MQRIFCIFALLQATTCEDARNNTKMQRPVSAGMHIAHALMHWRSQDFGLGRNLKSHAMTSSKIFEKRDFLGDKESKIRSRESGLAPNQNFAKGEGLEPQVKKFYKYIETEKGGEQISATQTCHRQGLGAERPAAGGYGGQGAKPPSRQEIFCNFWKKQLF